MAVIANVPAPVELLIMQFTDQIDLRYIMKSVSGISTVLQGSK